MSSKNKIKTFFLVFILLVALRTTAQKGNTVTDVDGNVYHTVKIGSQWWMQENLKTTHYRDGSPITEIELKTPWSDAADQSPSIGAWCYFQSNPEKNIIYGKLYNWYAIADPKNVCPTGWHVPSDDDYTLLTDYLGGDEIAGGKMKAMTLWSTPNIGANNSSGFTALPAGARTANGTFDFHGGRIALNDTAGWRKSFDRTAAFCDFCYFWSSTKKNGNTAWVRSLYYNWSRVFRDDYNKNYGLSVRCLGD